MNNDYNETVAASMEAYAKKQAAEKEEDKDINQLSLEFR